MRKIVLLMSTVLVLALTAGPAFAYDFPSTNDANRDAGLPHVNEVSSAPGQVTLEFTNADANQLSFFEVRLDGQQTGTTPHPVVEDDTIHDGVCVDTRTTRVCSEGPVVMTFTAEELVEVRLALGGERDWDFDWTPFFPGAQPQTKDDCKDGGWEAFGFANQGQCIRYVNTGQDSRV